MDRGDAARMKTRKNRAKECVEQLAGELGVASAVVEWSPRSLDGQWSMRVTWQGGFRVVTIDEDLLIDEDTGAKFDGVVLDWFNGMVAPLCPELDDDAELK